MIEHKVKCYGLYPTATRLGYPKIYLAYFINKEDADEAQRLYHPQYTVEETIAWIRIYESIEEYK